MATALNYTSKYFTLVPRGYNSSNLSYDSVWETFGTYGGSNQILVSANAPIVYQFRWIKDSMTESDLGSGTSGERVEGDMVNAVFTVKMVSPSLRYLATWPTDYKTIAVIKKSKDIASTHPQAPYTGSAVTGHLFTIDISQIVADQLSYSLVPIMGGSWGTENDGTTGPTFGSNQSIPAFGGMNGQWEMNTIQQGVSGGNVLNATLNGTGVLIRVFVQYEVQNAVGELELSSTGRTDGGSYVMAINSVPQWGDVFNHARFQVTSYDGDPDRKFLSMCPNGDVAFEASESPEYIGYNKKIRVDDEGEYLQFFLEQVRYSWSEGTGTVDECWGIALKVEISDDNMASWARTRYLVDFSAENRLFEGTVVVTGAKKGPRRHQWLMCVQNVSPAYIEQHNNGQNVTNISWHIPGNTAGAFTNSSTHYRVSVIQRDSAPLAEFRTSEYRYYEIDREEPTPFGSIKFFWLNRMGGIDSFTAKRDVSRSVEVSQNTITRKKPWRRWIRDNSTNSNFDDSVGGNMYPHSREVLNVNANSNYTVFSDPITFPEATWLEEIFTSSNVWIEKETEGSKYLEAYTGGGGGGGYGRPSKKGYFPVLITNGGSTLINEAEGLVQVQFEYTDSHEINTQRT